MKKTGSQASLSIPPRLQRRTSQSSISSTTTTSPTPPLPSLSSLAGSLGSQSPELASPESSPSGSMVSNIKRLAAVSSGLTSSGSLSPSSSEAVQVQVDPALTGLAKMLAFRARLCTETRDTEYSYLTQLRTAIQSFLTPIKEKLGKPDEILNAEEINLIFNNVTEVEEHAANLWRELAARCKGWTDDTCIADVFLKYLDKGFTNCYVNYINGYELAIAAIESRFKSRKDKFTLFIKAVEEKEKDQSYFKNLSFTSFLVTPVQRIPRYVMLLKDIMKNTPEDHPDFENVKVALEKVSKIASLINEKKREDENLRRMQEFVEHFENKEEILPLQLATLGRSYIAEGVINEVLANGVSESRTLVVLSDMFIATTKKKDKYTYRWKVNFLNCKVEERDDGFRLSELRKIPQHPFILEESIVLSPVKDGQFTSEFWNKTFSSATQNFWTDQKKRIVQNSQEMKRHMTEHLLTEKDWRLLQTSMTTLNLKKDDVILKEGEVFKNLYWIKSGRVRVQKVLGEQAIVFARMGENEFFGEMSYLKKKEQRIGASVIADLDDTVIQYIPEDKLDTLLLANLALAERFFKLLCYILASRFVERPLEEALQKKTKTTQEEEEEEGEEAQPQAAKPAEGGKPGEKKEDSKKEEPKKEGKKEEKKKKTVEEKKLKGLLSTLKLPNTEVLLEEFPAKLKDKKLHGQLYVFQKHIGFYSKIFGRKTTLVLPINTVTDLVKEGTLILSITASKKLHTLSFERTEERDQAEAIIKNQRGGTALQRATSILLDTTKGQGAVRNDALKLQPKDWEEILYGCATTVSCKADDPILRQGDIQMRLYQVVDGQCRVELLKRATSETPEQKLIVGSIKKGEVFGELSFVLGGIASASVVADKQAVKVVYFERAKLDALFQQKPKLGAGFYFYLARQIRNRLMENQKRAAEKK